MNFGSLLEGFIGHGLSSQIENRLVIPTADREEVLTEANAVCDDEGLPHITLEQLLAVDRAIILYVEGRIGKQVGL